MNFKNILTLKTLGNLSVGLLFLVSAQTIVQGFSLDTRLLQAGSSIKTQEGIKGLTKTNDLALKGDIFRTLYEQQDFPQEQSTKKGISAIAQKLTAGGNCIMSNDLHNDVLFVLTSIPSIRSDLYQTFDIPMNNILLIGDAKRRQSASLNTSCRNILACLDPEQYTNKEKINNQNELNTCRQIVKDYFTLNQKLSKSYLSQTNDIKDNNIYINNTLDDSPFDLLVDLEDTKKILFQTQSPALPRMTFFSFPTVSIPNNSNTTNGLLGAVTLPSINSSNSPASSLANNSNERIGGTDTLASNEVAAFIQSNQQINTANNRGSDGISNNQSTANQSLADLIQAPLCLPADSNTTIDILTNTNTTDTNTTTDAITANQQAFDAAQSALMENMAPFLSYDDNRIGELGNTLLNDLDTIIQTNSPGAGANCQATCDALPTTGNATVNSISKQTCEANCCINSCKTISNARDKAVCLSQCLCTDTSFPGVDAKPELKKVFDNDMLRIRFCRVPAMNPIVQPNKQIMTIEEAVDGINAILGKLKAGGKLTPRNKQKEFFDSAFSDIKFKDILAFDIFVATKPLYDKISFANHSEKKKKNASDDRQVFILGGHDLSDSRERNKYIIIGSHAPALASRQPFNTYQDYQDLLANQQTIINSRKQQSDTNNALILADEKQGHDEILDELAEFYRANMLFWQQIMDKTDSFYQTSQTFVEKAIKAK